METGRSIRVIALLEEIARANGPLTANEIAERADLPKATVYRLCDQLVEAGLIQRQLVGRGFVCGPALVALSHSVQANQLQYSARRAILERLARDIGETCNVSVPARLSMIYWDRVETEWPLRLQLPVGTSVPLHATASGKLFLASLTPSRRDQIIEQLDLEPCTPNTLTGKDDLVSRLNEIADQGYSLDNEEFILDMVAIAVPITDNAGRFVAGLATHGPSQRMTPEIAKGYLPKLRAAAERLSKDLADHMNESAGRNRTLENV
ncbi:MAG: IclR family transcriptional regulator [Methyloligellaceae bacterium]